MSALGKISPYGPDNPHPLSQMKAELVWEGKYDEYGNRRAVRLPSTPLPLQRIETIDEPRDRSKALRLQFDEATAHRDDFRNMLIWGDNKLAMAALLEQFRGKIDLIYIDPPFLAKKGIRCIRSIRCWRRWPIGIHGAGGRTPIST